MPEEIKTTIEVKGLTKAVDDIRALGERATDVGKIESQLQRVFFRSEKKRFDESGPGWKQLADATKAIKQSNGQSLKILRATGRLMASLTSGGGDALVEKSPFTGEIRFGTKVDYAMFHQYGTVNMPKRLVIKLSPAEKKQMTLLVQEFVAKGKT